MRGRDALIQVVNDSENKTQKRVETQDNVGGEEKKCPAVALRVRIHDVRKVGRRHKDKQMDERVSHRVEVITAVARPRGAVRDECIKTTITGTGRQAHKENN